ncbi:MAG: 1,4-dihydroxy-2-naphthoate octaprenyltransferase [Owenweeksia sp. TMED14]|nr:MAG: 1,4-dihydroxy-2-naphthoate octaprenyltransferase [Owenweeksia sp. TMED14]
MRTKTWISVLRLRTLPLALSCILLGSFISASQGFFSPFVFVLTILSAIAYQLLSNVANDFGDAKSGADSLRSEDAEIRVVATGEITIAQIHLAVRFFTFISVFLTAITAFYGSRGFTDANLIFIFFLLLGASAIWASREYTIGSAYGYKGLGDVFVIFFFGPVGVVGSYVLQSKGMDLLIFLPGLSVGFLAATVLNLNNMRDIESDRNSNKRTLALSIGILMARIYHTGLVVAAVATSTIFVILKSNLGSLSFLFISTIPFLAHGLYRMWNAQSPREFDLLLKPAALVCVLFSFLIGLGLFLDSDNYNNLYF